MYERMLNKQEQPQYNEMCMHCKECGELFAGLNTWLMETFATQQEITFPYGNHYGWGIAHRKRNKLMCNVFPSCCGYRIHNLHRYMSSCSLMQRNMLITDIPVATAAGYTIVYVRKLIWKIFSDCSFFAVTKDTVVWK